MNLIATIDMFGAIFLLVAFIISLKNYKVTKSIGAYWAVFSIACFLGFLWALSVSLEWFGFYPLILDEMEQIILASSATAFAICAIITVISFVKPLE